MFRHMFDLSPVNQAETYPQADEYVNEFCTPGDVEGFEDNPAQLDSLFLIGVLEDVGRLIFE